MGIYSRNIATHDRRALDYSSAKTSVMQADASDRSGKTGDSQHGASEGKNPSKFYHAGMPTLFRGREKFLPQNSIGQSGTASFWGIILLLTSAALVLFGLSENLRSKKDLHHMQTLFSCAYGYSILIRSKVARIQLMTKKIGIIRKAELAAKAIPLPPSQAAGRALEASRLVLEAWQNGFITMAQANFMKYQISGCRGIKVMNGDPLGAVGTGHKIVRDPVTRFPLLKLRWNTCLEHAGHSMGIDQRQVPQFSLKSTYGLPCALTKVANLGTFI
jgi:hypothetical protein